MTFFFSLIFTISKTPEEKISALFFFIVPLFILLVLIPLYFGYWKGAMFKDSISYRLAGWSVFVKGIFGSLLFYSYYYIPLPYSLYSEEPLRMFSLGIWFIFFILFMFGDVFLLKKIRHNLKNREDFILYLDEEKHLTLPPKSFLYVFGYAYYVWFLFFLEYYRVLLTIWFEVLGIQSSSSSSPPMLLLWITILFVVLFFERLSTLMLTLVKRVDDKSPNFLFLWFIPFFPLFLLYINDFSYYFPSLLLEYLLPVLNEWSDLIRWTWIGLSIQNFVFTKYEWWKPAYERIKKNFKKLKQYMP